MAFYGIPWRAVYLKSAESPERRLGESRLSQVRPVEIWASRSGMEAQGELRRELNSAEANNVEPGNAEPCTLERGAQKVPSRAAPRGHLRYAYAPRTRSTAATHISPAPPPTTPPLHVGSPRASASSSAHRLLRPAQLGMQHHRCRPTARGGGGVKCACACPRPRDRGALYTQYRRGVRTRAPRPSATRSLRASLSHLVFPPLRCSPFTTLRATDRATSTSAGNFSRLCAPSGHM